MLFILQGAKCKNIPVLHFVLLCKELNVKTYLYHMLFILQGAKCKNIPVSHVASHGRHAVIPVGRVSLVSSK